MSERTTYICSCSDRAKNEPQRKRAKLLAPKLLSKLLPRRDILANIETKKEAVTDPHADRDSEDNIDLRDGLDYWDAEVDEVEDGKGHSKTGTHPDEGVERDLEPWPKFDQPVRIEE